MKALDEKMHFVDDHVRLVIGEHEVASSGQRDVEAKAKRRILMPLSDAFGGFGGIAQYNRDVIEAMSMMAEVEAITAIPRVITEGVGALPPKVDFVVGASGNAVAFVAKVLRHGLFGPRPDLIWCAHINYLPLCALIAMVRRVPLMLMIYGMEIWLKPPSLLKRWALRRVTRIGSISQFTMDRFINTAAIDHVPCEILPNAVRLEDYGVGPKPADLVTRFGLEGRRVIMTLARMPVHASKGFDAMLEAMPQVVKALPDALYLIGGRGEDEARLRSKAKGLALDNHVIFAGEIAENRKADFYRLADLFAMPSSGDGFGFVFIEALACGVPVLASTIDGGWEAVMRGKLGRGVDPVDLDALARQLIAGLGDRKGVPDLLQHYAFSAFYERLRQAMRRVLA